MLTSLQMFIGALSGSLVGLSLGLVGGGGSILAVPLMVYLVGVKNPHVAIGTSALAVAANAAIGLINHARQGTVVWRCGLMYAAAGIAGAFAGSTAGKAFDGQRLLFLFAIVMVVVGILMLRGRRNLGVEGTQCDRTNAPKVLSFGLGTGLFSGLFRDRRRLPHRPGSCRVDRHGDDQCRRDQPGGGHRLRPHHRTQLRRLRPHRLDTSGGVRCWWHHRQPRGDARSQAAFSWRSSNQRIRRPDLHRCRLHAVEKCGGHILTRKAHSPITPPAHGSFLQ